MGFQSRCLKRPLFVEPFTSSTADDDDDVVEGVAKKMKKEGQEGGSIALNRHLKR